MPRADFTAADRFGHSGIHTSQPFVQDISIFFSLFSGVFGAILLSRISPIITICRLNFRLFKPANIRTFTGKASRCVGIDCCPTQIRSEIIITTLKIGQFEIGIHRVWPHPEIRSSHPCSGTFYLCQHSRSELSTTSNLPAEGI